MAGHRATEALIWIGAILIGVAAYGLPVLARSHPAPPVLLVHFSLIRASGLLFGLTLLAWGMVRAVRNKRHDRVSGGEAET